MMVLIREQAAKAANSVVTALNYLDEVDDMHYHLTDGQDLTLVATLQDLYHELRGQIEEKMEELIGNPRAQRISNDTTGTEKVQVSGDGVDEITNFRVRPCDDPTCQKALQDHWL